MGMEVSFFVVCPLNNCECKAPKIGMNCNQSLTILFPFDSSRFSGQLSRIYKGITKKDTSMSMHLTKGNYVALSNSQELVFKELKCYQSSYLLYLSFLQM